MATSTQTQAARRNVQKAQRPATSKKTMSHLPSKTRKALGKQGAAVARCKRTGGTSPKTRGTVRDGPAARPAGPVDNGQR